MKFPTLNENFPPGMSKLHSTWPDEHIGFLKNESMCTANWLIPEKKSYYWGRFYIRNPLRRKINGSKFKNYPPSRYRLPCHSWFGWRTMLETIKKKPDILKVIGYHGRRCNWHFQDYQSNFDQSFFRKSGIHCIIEKRYVFEFRASKLLISKKTWKNFRKFLPRLSIIRNFDTCFKTGFRTFIILALEKIVFFISN